MTVQMHSFTELCVWLCDLCSFALSADSYRKVRKVFRKVRKAIRKCQGCQQVDPLFDLESPKD